MRTLDRILLFTLVWKLHKGRILSLSWSVVSCAEVYIIEGSRASCQASLAQKISNHCVPDGTWSTPLELAVSRYCGRAGRGWSLSARAPGPPPACLPDFPFPLVSGSSCLSFSSWDAFVWHTLRPLFPVKTSSQQRIWTFIESRIYVTIAKNNYS